MRLPAQLSLTFLLFYYRVLSDYSAALTVGLLGLQLRINGRINLRQPEGRVACYA